ncbi:SprT family protein [Bacillaceae bacterium SIJ1]|uniref:SprT family protein n=1 Tax=Litoribacterium kuwaitense TaxID=1398745 RepID=UPI0013ECC06E|nr:SprT family protein [Litoribacterium kuwaitense]NGP46240.1 SprT family protein [Litoribacterium kuwaitense]
MTDQELQTYVENISQVFFHKPFLHRACFNARLRTTGGRYVLNDHSIEINPKHVTEFGLPELEAIVKHELCHYHLHLGGKGYKHRDVDFKTLLQQVGGARHCRALPTAVPRHTYECISCGLQFKRQRQIRTGRYRCGKCYGKLKKVASDG